MQKDQAYHESAIEYNEGLADAAETLAKKLKHPEVRKWCISVGKQHRFHAGRHQKALDKLLRKGETDTVEQIPDGLDVQDPPAMPDPPMILVKDEEAGTVSWIEPESVNEGSDVLHDGCFKYHNPTLPNCVFNPNKEVANA